MSNCEERVCGICLIQEGMLELARGIALAEEAIREFKDCRFCEGVRLCERAIREMEAGLAKLELGLDNFELDRCARKEVADIICHIKECIKCIREALEAICRGDVENGICMLEKAVCFIKKDLAKLNDLIGVDRHCRRDKCRCNNRR